MPALQITDSEFQEKVLSADKPVLVDFWAPWCGPCRQMGPIVEELADDYEGKALVCKVNVDENPAAAQAFGISSIPTFIIFKDGDIVKGFVGGRPKSELAAALDAAL